MSAIGFLLLIIFAWFFYNLLVKIVIPVYKTTRQIRRQFKNMSEQRDAATGDTSTKAPTSEAPKEKVGEYIDFEEVK